MGDESDNQSAENFFQRLPAFWKCQLVGWSLLVPYAFLTRVAFWGDFRLAAFLTLFIEPFGFILSLGLRWLYRKIGWKQTAVWKTIAIAVVASFLAAVVQLAFSEWIFSLVADRFGDQRIARFTFFWLIFAFWSFGYFSLKNELEARGQRKRLEELEVSAQRAELATLKLQLNPHFLFNSLKNIAEEIPEDPPAAVAMTRQLAKFLRYTLERHDDRIVTLGEEIEAVRNYLAIEEIRFTNRLSTKIQVPPDIEDMRLPCLLLQPLVENAVKHGVMSCSPPWKLTVEVSRELSTLRVRISNTGRLLKDWRTRGNGIGISNLLRRLELHYPGRHRFQLFQEESLVIAELALEGVAVDD